MTHPRYNTPGSPPYSTPSNQHQSPQQQVYALARTTRPRSGYDDVDWHHQPEFYPTHPPFDRRFSTSAIVERAPVYEQWKIKKGADTDYRPWLAADCQRIDTSDKELAQHVKKKGSTSQAHKDLRELSSDQREAVDRLVLTKNAEDPRFCWEMVRLEATKQETPRAEGIAKEVRSIRIIFKRIGEEPIRSPMPFEYGDPRQPYRPYLRDLHVTGPPAPNIPPYSQGQSSPPSTWQRPYTRAMSYSGSSSHGRGPHIVDVTPYQGQQGSSHSPNQMMIVPANNYDHHQRRHSVRGLHEAPMAPYYHGQDPMLHGYPIFSPSSARDRYSFGRGAPQIGFDERRGSYGQGYDGHRDMSGQRSMRTRSMQPGGVTVHNTYGGEQDDSGSEDISLTASSSSWQRLNDETPASSSLNGSPVEIEHPFQWGKNRGRGDSGVGFPEDKNNHNNGKGRKSFGSEGISRPGFNNRMDGNPMDGMSNMDRTTRKTGNFNSQNKRDNSLPKMDDLSLDDRPHGPPMANNGGIGNNPGFRPEGQGQQWQGNNGFGQNDTFRH